MRGLAEWEHLESRLQTIESNTAQTGVRTADPTAFLPDFHQGWTTDALWTLPLLTFFVYLCMQWWLAWYPGAEPGGGGYVAQRMFSAKDEKNSLGATLWFNIAHYALRPWPWIITGLVAMAVYSPNGGINPCAAFAQNPEQGYVMVLRDYLPPALRGLMVAAFLAAFMSTVGTQLNWGCSYLVNDLYKRFMVRGATEKHYVLVSKLFTVLLVLATGYTAMQLTSIKQGWEIVLNIGFGTGAVYILRWYWWRINAWSEISAMIAAAGVTLALREVQFSGGSSLVYAKTALITGAVTTVAWLATTFITKPEKDATLIAFYRRVLPTVYGWKRIAKLVPELPEVRDVSGNAFDWVMGVVLVYGCLFGIGKSVFQQWISGAALLVIAAVAGYLIFWDLSRRGWIRRSSGEAASTDQNVCPDDSVRAYVSYFTPVPRQLLLLRALISTCCSFAVANQSSISWRNDKTRSARPDGQTRSRSFPQTNRSRSRRDNQHRAACALTQADDLRADK